MGTEVATTEKNAFEQYYEEAATSLIPFLKFVKGDYLAGRDEEELPLGHKLAVAMDLMEVGFQAWNDKEPIDSAMVRLASGQPRPKRSDLRDYPARIDKDGKTQDAWQESTIVPMRSVEDGREFLFTSSSKGGRNALAALAGAYGKGMRQHPGMLPVIQLDRDSYKHDDYGKVFTPLFRIVNWATEGELVQMFGAGVSEPAGQDDAGDKKAEGPKLVEAPKEEKGETKRATRF